MTTYNLILKQAVDTAANWAAQNPTLLRGEVGHESDTKKQKLGDGTTPWNLLEYTAHDWDSIENKPTEFYPITHGHPWENISGKPATYPPDAHNHAGVYSVVAHNHDGTYSLVGHTHDYSGVFAALGHNHDGTYANSVHTHDYSAVFAAIGHNHDSAYSASNHNHNGVYAVVAHNHDGTYSLVGHTHDYSLVYAALNHNHDSAYEAKNSNIQNHISDTNNPHSVTKSQVGLANVDNTSDANKPVSTATSEALAGKSPMSGFPVDGSGNYLCTLAYNEGTRTITVTPTVTSFDILVNGIKYTKTGAQTITHTTTQGAHFIYYNTSGTLVVTTTPWDLLYAAPVAFVYWDSANSRGIVFEERHHAGRDIYWHRNQHANEGTKVSSGFGISGYTLNTQSDEDITVAIATGRVEDEDIRIDTTPLPDAGPYTIIERVGVSGNWQITRSNTLPVIYTGITIQYNQNNGGTWQRTNVPNTDYMNMWVFVTTSITGQDQYIFVPGQATFGNASLAASDSVANISWGTLPFQEIAPLYKLTYQFGNGYAGSARCRLTAVTRVIGSAVTITQAAAFDHGALSGLSSDHHTLYALADGSRGSFASPSHGHNHNDTANIQGGTTDEYYHLTAAEYAAVVAGGASVTISDTAPLTPNSGDMWYDSVNASLMIYYNDGTSSQWIDATSGTRAMPETLITYSATGSIIPYTGTARQYPPNNFTVLSADMWVSEAATGADIIARIRKNGSIIQTLTLAAGQYKQTTTGLNISLLSSDYVTIDVTQVGSIVLGSNLNIRLRGN